MDSGYLESYAWIYAQASDLDQGVVLWGIWFIYSQILFENTKTSGTSKIRI